ncbi:MAG: IclR family transcriptional regulator C-terminal domain-containing protein [Chloroflexota bacterium]
MNQQLIDAAAPVFEQLNQTTREAVGLSTLEENCVVYIYHLKSKNSVQVVDWTNQSAPLHLTSSGKLFLAASSDKSQADYLAHPLESRTAKSIVSQSALRSELKKVVDQDYAITDEEFSPDVYGIAVPLRHPASGNIVAAITLYGPKYRILALNQSIALVEALKASAKEIEAGLRETN